MCVPSHAMCICMHIYTDHEHGDGLGQALDDGAAGVVVRDGQRPPGLEETEHLVYVCVHVRVYVLWGVGEGMSGFLLDFGADPSDNHIERPTTKTKQRF